MENLAPWSRLHATTGEVFQGSWSFMGLESMQGPRGHPVERGVAPEKRPLFGPSQRASSWFNGAEIHLSAERSLQHLDGVETNGCASVAKLNVPGISWINAHASARAVRCCAGSIQWAGTVQ